MIMPLYGIYPLRQVDSEQWHRYAIGVKYCFAAVLRISEYGGVLNQVIICVS